MFWLTGEKTHPEKNEIKLNSLEKNDSLEILIKVKDSIDLFDLIDIKRNLSQPNMFNNSLTASDYIIAQDFTVTKDLKSLVATGINYVKH
jgi:hypothetical protein